MSNDEELEIDDILEGIGFTEYKEPKKGAHTRGPKKRKPPTKPVLAPADKPIPKKLVEAKKIAHADGLSIDEYPDPNEIPNICIKKGIVPDKTLISLYQKGSRATKWTQRRAYKFFLDFLRWYRAETSVYFISEYYSLHGVSEKYLTEIRARYPICESVYQQLLELQETRVLNAGARELLHPGMVRFFLNCRYGEKYTPHKQVQNDVAGNLNVAANVTNLPVAITFDVVSRPPRDYNAES